MRKVMSVVLTVSLGFLGAALYGAATQVLPFHLPGSVYFTDVSPASPHNEDIGYLVEYGVAKGYADGTYHPDDVVTRAQMASFVMRSSAYDPFTSWIVVDDRYFDGYYFGIWALEDGFITYHEYVMFQDFLDWYFGLLDFQSRELGPDSVVPLEVQKAAQKVLARARAQGRNFSAR
jgi:S-layer homology domain